MKNLQHTAIDGSQIKITSPIINKILIGECTDYFPQTKGKKGFLFSHITLNKFIKEEAIHDDYTLTKESKRSIRSFSSGEQKKALINHLLEKQPDFLIIDNPFDALDANSVASMKSKLIELSHHIPIIQIFKRKNDLLPFISQIVKIESEEIVGFENIKKYIKNTKESNHQLFNGAIPPPYEDFKPGFSELVSFKNVCVNYGNRTILNNINWKIKQGEFWQLIGPNGSGKTTLLSMINGDNPKAYGQDIEIFGKKKGSGESIWELKKKIGYFTPSMTTLFPYRHTAMHMIVSGLNDSIGLYKKAGFIQKDLALDWLKLLGLIDKKDEPFVKLSMINQRLVLIARAMIKHPPLLILDEPSTGLDDKSAALLSALINKMAAEGSTAILYVSHRKEPDLNPKYIYELQPGDNGSTGKITAN